MQKDGGKADEDVFFSEFQAGDPGTVQQAGHGQVGICYMTKVMIVGITGPVFIQPPSIQINGIAENVLNRFQIKFRIDETDNMEYLFMDQVRRIHIDKCS